MITNAVLNISTDLLIIAIPMPVFLQSQLALKRKIILCAVFALGAFSVCLPRPPRDVPLKHHQVSNASIEMLTISYNTDPRSSPQQVLQLGTTLRQRLDLLVHPRSINCHHHGQLAAYLDPTPASIPPRLLPRCLRQVERSAHHWQQNRSRQVPLRIR